MRIARFDVPYAVRPWFVLLEAGLLAFMYVSILIGDPTLRPGYVQIAIATMLGVPMGFLFSLSWVVYVKDLSALARENPKIKWIATFYRVPTTQGGFMCFGAAAVAMGVGLFGICAILYVLWTWYPELVLVGLSGESISKVRDSGIFALWPPTILLYGAWIIGVSFCHIIRWYYSLPED